MEPHAHGVEQSAEALLALILSAVSDGAACLAETAQVLKPRARAVVFDKLSPEAVGSSFGRRVLDLLTNLFGNGIKRTFEPMAKACRRENVIDDPAAMGGLTASPFCESGVLEQAVARHLREMRSDP